MFCTTRAAKFTALPPLPTVLAALPWCLLFIQTTYSAIFCTESYSNLIATPLIVFVVILPSLSVRFFHLSSASLCTAIRILVFRLGDCSLFIIFLHYFSVHLFSNVVHCSCTRCSILSRFPSTTAGRLLILLSTDSETAFTRPRVSPLEPRPSPPCAGLEAQHFVTIDW